MSAASKRSIIVEVLGDDSKYTAAMKRAGTATQQLGKVIVSAYAAKKVIDFGISSVKAAMDDQAAQQILAKALQNTTNATDDQIKSIEDWITKSSYATGFLDDEMRPALATILRSTKDQTKAQDILTLAMDVSRGTGKDLETVSSALAKAYGGNTTALGRLVPGLKQAGEGTLSWADAQSRLNGQFSGSAATYAETAAGQMARLNAQYQDMKETIGMALMPVMTQLVSVFSTLFGWYNQLNPQQQQFLATVLVITGAVYAGVSAFSAVSKAVETFGLTMKTAQPWLLGAMAVIAVVTVGLSLFSDQQEEAKKRATDFYKAVANGIGTIDKQRLAFLGAADAAKEYSDVAYAEAEKKLRESVLGNKALVAAMQRTGLTIDEVVAATRGGIAATDAINKAESNLIGTRDYQIRKMREYNQITEAQMQTMLNQKDAEVQLRDTIRNQTQAQYDSTQTAIERMRVGDAEAAQWLKATGQLAELSRADAYHAEALIDSAAAAGDATSAQSDLGDETDDTTQATEDQIKALDDLWSAMRSAVDSDYALRDAKRDTTAAIADYTTALAKGKSSTADLTALQEKAEQAALKQADAAVRLAEDQAEANGTTVSAGEKNQIFIQSLADAAAAMAPDSPMRRHLLELMNEFNDFPSDKNATLTIDFVTGGTINKYGMKQYASGGRIGAGQFGMVGETGQPEIVNRPTIVRGPAQVTGVRETAAAMAGGPAGSFSPTFIVNERTTAKQLADEAIWQWRIASN